MDESAAALVLRMPKVLLVRAPLEQLTQGQQVPKLQQVPQ
tara:strand:- start:137 stop:256 length:120 start_codon:yes stop_codon:yes gene_type:complete